MRDLLKAYLVLAGVVVLSLTLCSVAAARDIETLLVGPVSFAFWFLIVYTMAEEILWGRGGQ